MVRCFGLRPRPWHRRVCVKHPRDAIGAVSRCKLVRSGSASLPRSHNWCVLVYVATALGSAVSLGLVGVWLKADRDPRWVVAYVRYGTRIDHRLIVPIAVFVDAVLISPGAAADASSPYWAAAAAIVGIQFACIAAWLAWLRGRREPLVWRHLLWP